MATACFSLNTKVNQNGPHHSLSSQRKKTQCHFYRLLQSLNANPRSVVSVCETFMLLKLFFRPYRPDFFFLFFSLSLFGPLWTIKACGRAQYSRERMEKSASEAVFDRCFMSLCQVSGGGRREAGRGGGVGGVGGISPSQSVSWMARHITIYLKCTRSRDCYYKL